MTIIFVKSLLVREKKNTLTLGIEFCKNDRKVAFFYQFLGLKKLKALNMRENYTLNFLEQKKIKINKTRFRKVKIFIYENYTQFSWGKKLYRY